MKTHTPGPWEASGLLINTVEPSTIDGAGRTIHHWKQIAEVRLFGGHRWDSPECHANARLIAAAPDLLSELKSVTDFLEQLVLYERVNLSDSDEVAVVDRLLMNAAAAIARAEGRA